MDLIDKTITNFINGNAFSNSAEGPGIAVCVVTDNAILYRNTFGYADHSKQIPITTKTLFSISSCTKAITAMAFMILHEKKKILLNSPIKKGIVLFDPIVTDQLSYIDILSHRSGLPSNDLFWLLAPFEQQELLEKIQHLDLVPDSFRKSFIYNNLLYSALGASFQNNHNESLENFIEREVLKPLEMNSTSFSNPESFTDVALPYAGAQRLDFRNTKLIKPAGGLYSNIEDMTNWLKFQLGSGQTHNGQQLISKENLAFSQSIQNVIHEPIPFILQGLDWVNNKAGYGLGWFIGETAGYKAIFHPGYVDGFSTVVVLFPDLKLGIVVLMNQHFSPFPAQLSQYIFEQVMNKKLDPTSPPHLEQPIVTEEVTTNILEADFETYAGTYEDSAYGMIKVIEKKEHNNLQIYLNYYGYNWKLTSHSKETFTFTIETFGMQLPMMANFVFFEKNVRELRIPMSLDPRVPPRVFHKRE